MSIEDHGSVDPEIDAEKERAERTRQIGIAALVIVVVAAIAAGLLWSQSGSDAATKPSPKLKSSQAGYALAIGNPTAPVHVVVYEDFDCVPCRDFEFASRDFLHADATNGKAYVEYRPVAHAGAYSRTALNAFAAVLHAKGPAAALKYHDLLFDNQPEAGQTPPDNSFLIDLASKAGVKAPEVADAIDSTAYAAWVTNGNAVAAKAHATVPPVVQVDGTALTASSVDDLATSLERLIAKGP